MNRRGVAALVFAVTSIGARAQGGDEPAFFDALPDLPILERAAGNAFEATPPLSAASMQGIASWYGIGFHGRRTASGERFDMHALTAAHPTLPFGTRVLVENLGNGRSVVVRINDRGPHIAGRIIDLSHAAARAIGLLGWGTKPVLVTPVPGEARIQ